MNLVTITKPLSENVEDNRDDLLQQCTDAEKRVHQNVEKLRDCEGATCGSGNLDQSTILVYISFYIISHWCILAIINFKITIG